MTASGLCDNPNCTCDPCLCEDCRCNTARLGRLEQQVMAALWQAREELGGREVAQRLPSHAYTTLVTVLDRLSHKGLVRRRLEGRTRRYAAIGTEADHAATLMHEALRRGGDPGLVLTAFLSAMTGTERSALEQGLAADVAVSGRH